MRDKKTGRSDETSDQTTRSPTTCRHKGRTAKTANPGKAPQGSLATISEKGIFWTKIEDITERADIGKGTFYRYFPTKDALLLTLLREGLEALTSAIRARLQSTSDSSQAIRQVIDAQFDFYLESPEYLLLFHQVSGLLQLQGTQVTDFRGSIISI
jgi:AcrR family transcriptional regulator